MLSRCCNTDVVPVFTESSYYECFECGWPCDLKSCDERVYDTCGVDSETL